jgi:hypothetical protein
MVEATPLAAGLCGPSPSIWPASASLPNGWGSAHARRAGDIDFFIVLWRIASKNFRDRCEERKILFSKASPFLAERQPPSQTQFPQEDNVDPITRRSFVSQTAAGLAAVGLFGEAPRVADAQLVWKSWRVRRSAQR